MCTSPPGPRITLVVTRDGSRSSSRWVNHRHSRRGVDGTAMGDEGDVGSSDSTKPSIPRRLPGAIRSAVVAPANPRCSTMWTRADTGGRLTGHEDCCDRRPSHSACGLHRAFRTDGPRSPASWGDRLLRGNECSPSCWFTCVGHCQTGEPAPAGGRRCRPDVEHVCCVTGAGPTVDRRARGVPGHDRIRCAHGRPSRRPLHPSSCSDTSRVTRPVTCQAAVATRTQEQTCR
jgi:hypothetical protein